jgi:hypothetical protein
MSIYVVYARRIHDSRDKAHTAERESHRAEFPCSCSDSNAASNFVVVERDVSVPFPIE